VTGRFVQPVGYGPRTEKGDGDDVGLRLGRGAWLAMVVLMVVFWGW